MSVSRDDVRHVAQLARIAVPDARLDALVGELGGILAHMDALQAADTSGVVSSLDHHAGMVRRPDEGPATPLDRSRESIAPQMRDGFFLVPRLATHEDAGEEG